MESADRQRIVTLQQLLHRLEDFLRRAFRTRWKNRTWSDWNEDETCGKELFSAVRAGLRESLSSSQQTAVQLGDCNRWDLELLVKIIHDIKFGRSERAKKFEKQISLLRKLVALKEELDEHPSIEFTEAQFEEHWASIESVLLLLGDSPLELDEIKRAHPECETVSEKRQRSNPSEASLLKKEGNKMYKTGKTMKAIDLYSAALSVCGVSDEKKSVLHSDRAAAYLELAKTEHAGRILDNALADAETALKLNPAWSRASYTVGCAYKAKEEHERALEYFEAALALEPGDENCRAERDNCRLQLNGGKSLTYTRVANPLDDHLKYYNEQAAGSNVYVELIKPILEKTDGMVVPGSADLITGHRFLEGVDGVELCYETAAEFYRKAARQGNAQAMYNLALLTKDGNGVEEDLRGMIEWMKRAAEQPSTITKTDSGTGDGILPNPGVAEAEFSLGVFYTQGVGVGSCLQTAFHWFQRASEHGSGDAAYSVAFCYLEGRGVERSKGRGVECLELSASRGNWRAMEALAYHNLEHGDRKVAAEWFQRSKENGNSNPYKKFEAAAESMENQLNNFGIVTWEQENALTPSSMTLNERTLRMTSAVCPEVTRLFQLHKRRGQKSEQPSSGDSSLILKRDTFSSLMKAAAEGSVTASTVLKALSHFGKAAELLETSPSQDSENAKAIIHELAECYRTELLAAHFTPKTKAAATSLVVHTLSNIPEGEISQLDNDVRVCYAYLHFDSLEEVSVFVKHSIEKYPNEVCFYQALASAFAYLKKWAESLDVMEEALKRFPGDVELLYAKAVVMRRVDDQVATQIISAYKHFLELAPPDHRKVHEAYYEVAIMLIVGRITQLTGNRVEQFAMREDKRMTENAMAFYEKGVEAEEKLLACFAPCSELKATFREYLKLKNRLDGCPTAPPRKEAAATTTFNADCITTPLEELDPKLWLRLTDPNRAAVIVRHRQDLAHDASNADGGLHELDVTIMDPPTRKPATSDKGYVPITLRKMNRHRDQVYVGKLLRVTLIEDGSVGGRPSNGNVLQDSKGDVQRVFIDNLPQDENLQSKVGFGCKLTIFDPCVRIATDGLPAVHVDDPSLVTWQEREEKKCRFCGRVGAPLACVRCKRSYCSKECQTHDWKLLKHKLICSVPLR